MNNLFLVPFLLFSLSGVSQAEKEIDSLNYAGFKIAAPDGCKAASEYELLDCDGTSVQWLYLNEEMLDTIPEQFLEQFSKHPSTRKRSKITVHSLGSELKGFKFRMKDSYRIIVYGTVKTQPLLLNIGSDMNLKKTAELNSFLKEIIEIK